MHSARLLGTARVEGYGLHFHKRSVDDSAKCSIAAPGSGIYVAVYELSRADKSVLDGIEGVGAGYEEGVIAVPGFDRCATYVAEPDYVDESMHPYDWYRELVLLGCRYHRFPDEYVASIAAINPIPDPVTRRREQNERLIERINRNR